MPPAGIAIVATVGLVVFVGLSRLSERAHSEQNASDRLTQVNVALGEGSTTMWAALAAGAARPAQLAVIARHRREAHHALVSAARAAAEGDRSDGYASLLIQLRTVNRRMDRSLALLAERRARAAVGYARRAVAPAAERLHRALERQAATERAQADEAHATFGRWLLLTIAGCALLVLALGGALARVQRSRRRALRRFRTLLQNLSDVVVVVDHGGQVLFVTDPVERMLGYQPDELIGGDLLKLATPDAREALARMIAESAPTTAPVRCRVEARGGCFVEVEIMLANLTAEADVKGVAVTLHDVTERTRLEAELRHRALHDALTELPNRALFEDRVEHALDRAARDGTVVAVCFLDLDDFKAVNDSLGHAAGDRFLIATAERLRGCLRAEDTAARLGGDEFAVLVEGLANAEQTQHVAQRLFDGVGGSIAIDGREVFLRASIGVAAARPGQRGEELLRDADVAMYVAKRNGKHRYELFSLEMRSQASERLGLQLELEAAIARDEITVAYQPIVALDSGRTVGVEALARWAPPGADPIPPNTFIPVAENSGLIVQLGRLVLRHACRRAAAWQQEPPGLMLTVNVSPNQLRHPAFLDHVTEALAESGLPADRLTLELTEWALADSGDGTRRTLQRLKALGLQLAVDDFGTGYSSLSYLSSFPIDLLKLDRSLIDAIPSDERQLALVRGVTALAHDLGLSVLAEGIESSEQLAPLRRMHCQLAQGFHFTTPLDAAGIDELLATGRHQPVTTDGTFVTTNAGG